MSLLTNVYLFWRTHVSFIRLFCRTCVSFISLFYTDVWSNCLFDVSFICLFCRMYVSFDQYTSHSTTVSLIYISLLYVFWMRLFGRMNISFDQHISLLTKICLFWRTHVSFDECIYLFWRTHVSFIGLIYMSLSYLSIICLFYTPLLCRQYVSFVVCMSLLTNLCLIHKSHLNVTFIRFYDMCL